MNQRGASPRRSATRNCGLVLDGPSASAYHVSETKAVDAPGQQIGGTPAREVYTRILDYCRQVYQEEKERTQRLNDAVKVYLTFTSIVVAVGTLRVVTVDELVVWLRLRTAVPAPFLTIGAILFALSFVLFAASAICTIAVLRVWKFERLCDPERVAATATASETDLLCSMIADYAVAANRNYAVNERKARLLSYGLLLLILAVLLFGSSWFFVRFLALIWSTQ